MSPTYLEGAGPNLELLIKTEPLVGALRNFVGRETDTFSTVRKYKEASVSFNFFKKYIFAILKTNIFLNKIKKKYRLLDLHTVPQQ